MLADAVQKAPATSTPIKAMRIAGDIFNLEKGVQPMAELLQEAFGTVVWEVQSGNTRA